MSIVDLAQPGVLSDPTAHAEYLTFVLRDGEVDPTAVADALAMLVNATKSIRQKDGAAHVTSTIGIGARAWPRLFPEVAPPPGLDVFPELSDADRHFPSTPGDIFVMIKSTRIDLNIQIAKYLCKGFAPIAELIEDVQGFQYLDGRDLIDFVDGTENPVGNARRDAVLVAEGAHAGGAHLFVQVYVDRQAKWDAQSVEQQEGVIGRTKFDDIEISDDKKQPFAHNVRSKVVDENGEEVKMYRQNRAFGNALEHGTVFVGFTADADVIRTSLRQMIIADADGNYDHLLDFVDARSGAAYFVPPLALITGD